MTTSFSKQLSNYFELIEWEGKSFRINLYGVCPGLTRGILLHQLIYSLDFRINLIAAHKYFFVNYDVIPLNTSKESKKFILNN